MALKETVMAVADTVQPETTGPGGCVGMGVSGWIRDYARNCCERVSKVRLRGGVGSRMCVRE